MAGKLIVCATPIGNLEDMTVRVVRALKEADLIAAEDTRNSIRLLNHFDIHTPMTSYHENNRYEKARELVAKMQQGTTVALITDAGTPAISDPGEELVRQAAEAGIEVTSLPGAAACITALTLSALSTRRFAFEAFLPMDKKERRERLAELAGETRTIVLYEAPHRLRRTLEELRQSLGGERKISLCRELTKKHEEVIRTTLDGAVSLYEEQEPRGEYVLVVEGRDPAAIREEKAAAWQTLTMEEHMALYTDQGIDRKEAMKLVAKDRGIGKREVYAALNADRP
jgi:16S rRNA (cytidine1402-2'-O)-methyltransferase